MEKTNFILRKICLVSNSSVGRKYNYSKTDRVLWNKTNINGNTIKYMPLLSVGKGVPENWMSDHNMLFLIFCLYRYK